MKLENLNLKFLIKAHTKLGLFALFFFYISAFFGTITLFKSQIHTWETPSRYFKKEEIYNYKLDELINRTIIEEGFSSQRIEITLPNYKDDVIAINDPSSRTKYINPYTLKMLNTTSDKPFLNNFFNEIHIGRNIPKIGQFLMGIASILTIFLIISGVMLFINKHKTKKTFNFKWHRDLSLLLLPYIVVFALTGSVLGFMLSSSSPLAFSATKGENLNMRSLVAPILFKRDKIPSKTKEKKMLNIDTLMTKAKDNYENLQIQKITLLQWNDNNAKIKFSGYLDDNRILTGKVNRQFIVLSGVDGSILEKQNLDTVHKGNTFLSAFYFFHFLPDETLIVRVIYFVLGVVFLLSLVFGFLIWSDKKISKYKENQHYYNFLNRLSIALMFGVIPSTALTLLLYWAIPSEMFQRMIWIKGCFYAFWAFCLLLCTYIDDLIDLLKSLAFLTSIFLLATVLTHFMQINELFVQLLKSDANHTAIFFDITLLVFSLAFYLFYKFAHKIEFLNRFNRSTNVN